MTKPLARVHRHRRGRIPAGLRGMPRAPPPVSRSAPSAFPFVGKGCRGRALLRPPSVKAINIEIQPREFPKFTAPEDSAVSFPRRGRARARARFRLIRSVLSRSRERYRRSATRCVTSNPFSDASCERSTKDKPGIGAAEARNGARLLPPMYGRFVFVTRADLRGYVE